MLHCSPSSLRLAECLDDAATTTDDAPLVASTATATTADADIEAKQSDANRQTSWIGSSCSPTGKFSHYKRVGHD